MRRSLFFAALGTASLVAPAALGQAVKSFPDPSPASEEKAPPTASQPPAPQPPAPQPPAPEPEAGSPPPASPARVAPGSESGALQPDRAGPVSGVAIPSSGQWRPSEPPVLSYAGYRLERRMDSALVYGGLVTLIVAYGAGLAIAATDDFKNGSGWLVVPVIGPWVAMGERELDVPCQLTTPGVTNCVGGGVRHARQLALQAADGVIQAVGASLLLIGLASERLEWLPETPQLGTLRLVPSTVGGGYGASLNATF